LVPLLAIAPSICEATLIGLVSHTLFDIPYVWSFCMGFVVAAVSPSVIVPALISLNDRGYGRKNGLVTAMIASGTFDDIICIILFGITKTIAYNEYGMSSGQSMGYSIGILFAQNIVGLVSGIILGCIGWVFKFIKNDRLRIYAKFCYSIAGAIAFVVVGE
jgi:hypothetical protein